MGSPRTTPTAVGHANVPIIGIGASAGGLQALERFLAPVTATCRQAFVVIQHLAPTRTPMLVELLQRESALPVEEIVDGTVVQSGHIYVIPAGRDLSILNGVLLLLEPTAERGQRLTIDHFFRALAEDVGERAIGVLLSGMGTDGMLGLRAIKDAGGATFVQRPDTAQFSSMPDQAISAHVADVVGAPEELFPAITAQLERRGPYLEPVVETGHPSDDGEDDALDAPFHAVGEPSAQEVAVGLDKVMLLVRTRTGHEFSQYKRSTLSRRVARRMHAHRVTSMAEYVRLLQLNPSEADALFRDLLIGVTRFFRDPAAWVDLAGMAIPKLLSQHPEGGAIRAWVPGCSTGEEAYSLAIVFRETIARLRPSVEYTFQTFATDLDMNAVTRGRAAVFPPSIADDVSPERLRRFFVSDEHGFRLTKQIREMVIFAPQNLVMDPPFTRLDLISCRNLLIYLTTPLQRRLFPLFHYALRPGGMLFLGSAETVGSGSTLFTPVSEPSRIYRRADARVPLRTINFPGDMSRITSLHEKVTVSEPAAAPDPIRGAMERHILERFAATALLVDDTGRLLRTVGDPARLLGAPTAEGADDTGAWLSSSASPLARAILAALPDVPAAPEAIRVQSDISPDDALPEDAGRRATAEIQRMPAPDGSAVHFLVLLTEDLAVDDGGQSGDGHLSRELSQRSLELERARRDTQTTQQELRSANEELQSANEELTTSKEEMQSMNEELQTVNHELQAKLDELTLASNDMTNLLNSTSIATLFLDADLLVRRFTTPTTQIIHLIPGDVGRPITDLVSALDFPEMATVAREVLRTLVVFEREVAARDGRWFVVRIMPYRTHDDRIDGVVLTFTDATKAKTLESVLRTAHVELEGRLATMDSRAPTSARQEPTP